MKALTIKEMGGPPVLVERAIPSVRSTYMLVKVAAVALNPADNMVRDYGLVLPNHMMGCDWAGTVIEVGEHVSRSFKAGDRVCGCSRSGESTRDDVGVFNEYAVVKADLALHIPDSMRFTDAAALGVAVITTGRCIFDTFNLPYPDISTEGKLAPPKRPPRQIFIYGGSSCMGTITTQFAKLAGFHVMSTASSANKQLVESYGADLVVDHYSPDSPASIASRAKDNAAKYGPLQFCMDCISEQPSAIFCSKVLNPSAAPPTPETPPEWMPAHVESELKYSTITPLTPPLPGVKTLRTVGYDFLGEEWEFMGAKHPMDLQSFERSKKWMAVAEKLLAAGLFRPHPVDVQEGGLEGIGEGLKKLKAGKASGKKLVYLVDPAVC